MYTINVIFCNLCTDLKSNELNRHSDDENMANIAKDKRITSDQTFGHIYLTFNRFCIFLSSKRENISSCDLETS